MLQVGKPIWTCRFLCLPRKASLKNTQQTTQKTPNNNNKASYLCEWCSQIFPARRPTKAKSGKSELDQWWDKGSIGGMTTIGDHNVITAGSTKHLKPGWRGVYENFISLSSLFFSFLPFSPLLIRSHCLITILSMVVAFHSRVLIVDSQGQGKVRFNTRTFVLPAATSAEICAHSKQNPSNILFTPLCALSNGKWLRRDVLLGHMAKQDGDFVSQQKLTGVGRNQQCFLEVMEKEVFRSICEFAPGPINIFFNCYSFYTSIKLNYK